MPYRSAAHKKEKRKKKKRSSKPKAMAMVEPPPLPPSPRLDYIATLEEEHAAVDARYPNRVTDPRVVGLHHILQHTVEDVDEWATGATRTAPERLSFWYAR